MPAPRVVASPPSSLRVRLPPPRRCAAPAPSGRRRRFAMSPLCSLATVAPSPSPKQAAARALPLNPRARLAGFHVLSSTRPPLSPRPRLRPCGPARALPTHPSAPPTRPVLPARKRLPISRRLGCSLGSGRASSPRGSPPSSYARTSMTSPPPPPSLASLGPSPPGRQSASPSSWVSKVSKEGEHCHTHLSILVTAPHTYLLTTYYLLTPLGAPARRVFPDHLITPLG